MPSGRVEARVAVRVEARVAVRVAVRAEIAVTKGETQIQTACLIFQLCRISPKKEVTAREETAASGESGDDDGAAEREQSGGDLKDAGDSIAKTGDMLGDAASGGVSGAAGAGGSEMEGASGEGSGEGVDLLETRLGQLKTPLKRLA
jgi:hypothetical protein